MLRAQGGSWERGWVEVRELHDGAAVAGLACWERGG